MLANSCRLAEAGNDRIELELFTWLRSFVFTVRDVVFVVGAVVTLFLGEFDDVGEDNSLIETLIGGGDVVVDSVPIFVVTGPISADSTIFTQDLDLSINRIN